LSWISAIPIKTRVNRNDGHIDTNVLGGYARVAQGCLRMAHLVNEFTYWHTSANGLSLGGENGISVQGQVIDQTENSTDQ